MTLSDEGAVALAHWRVGRAKAPLRAGELSVTEVCLTVGLTRPRAGTRPVAS